jgi:pyrroloquinoline quinone (PQQ) biosynthesis protein C
MAVCKSYEYMYLFLERCMTTERSQEVNGGVREHRVAARA